jgi:hypothetical protein
MDEFRDMNNFSPNHLSEEQMILHFYDEPGSGTAGGAASHLSECAECQQRFASLRTLLNSVDTMRVPERGDGYGAEVWKRVEWRMRGVRPAARSSSQWKQWAAIAAMLAVGIGGYAIGKWQQQTARPELSDVASKVLMVALTEHLERSQVVMKELSNVAEPDIRYEREEASDLLESNRLYRQSAARQGDTQTVVLLEDLERLLTEIAHSPDKLGAAELEALRQRIEDESFKVKVLSSHLERQAADREKRGNNKL